MWEFLSKLPTAWSSTIIVAAIIAIVVVALKGKLSAKWGKNAVDVGAGSSVKESKDTPKDEKNKTLPAKKSCGDCVLIMMGEREKYEIKTRKTIDRVLKNQMNNAEQKLVEIQTLLINAFTEALYDKRNDQNEHTVDDEAVQSKLFYGLVRDALLLVKDEIRRSFKENGFFDFNGSEFTFYVRDKIKFLLSILSQHLRNLYPSQGVIVDLQKILKSIESKTTEIEALGFEMYTHAKEAKLEAEKQTKELRTEFSNWIDSFIG